MELIFSFPLCSLPAWLLCDKLTFHSEHLLLAAALPSSKMGVSLSLSPFLPLYIYVGACPILIFPSFSRPSVPFSKLLPFVSLLSSPRSHFSFKLHHNFFISSVELSSCSFYVVVWLLQHSTRMHARLAGIRIQCQSVFILLLILALAILAEAITESQETCYPDS